MAPPGGPYGIGPTVWDVDKSGVLYGSAYAGGYGLCSGGCGIFFYLTPPATAGGGWGETVIFGLPGGSVGTRGAGPVAAAPHHQIVAAGLIGGKGFSGQIYLFHEKSGVWKKESLHGFTGPDGLNPNGLQVDPTGIVYGTTSSGGANGYGVVYQISPPTIPGGLWMYTVLYSFTGGSDGASPTGLTLVNGSLYGGTSSGGAGPCNSTAATPGCGTVWQLSPPPNPGDAWIETTLYSFTGNGDGSGPGAIKMDQSGNLYGVACGDGCGGSNTLDGTVFELSPPVSAGAPWTESTLYVFTGQNGDGSGPNTLVVDASGVLYGTTYGGGKNGNGALFSLTPPAVAGANWTEAILHNFTYTTGEHPSGLVIGRGGALYGGGLRGDKKAGVVYKLVP